MYVIFYLHLVDLCGKLVCKYTVRPMGKPSWEMDGLETRPGLDSCILHFLLPGFTEKYPLEFVWMGLTSWWFFTNRFEKYAKVTKLDHETPGIGVKISKNIWNHHLAHLFKDSHHYVKLQRNIEQVWNQMKRHQAPQSLEEVHQAPTMWQRNLQPKHTVANQTVKPNGKPKRCETSNVLWRHVSSVVQSWRPLLKNDGNNMFLLAS